VPEAVGSFLGAEDFLDPGADRPQRAVVRFEHFGGQPAMTLAHQLRYSAFGFDRLFNCKRVVSAIGIHFTRPIGDERRRNRDIGLIARSRLDRADNPGPFVGANMRRIAMHGRAAFMLCPGGLLVALGCRSDDRHIDQRALAHASALLFEIAGDRGKQALIKTMFDKLAAETDKGGALGRRIIAGKAAKAPEACAIRERLGERDVGKIMPGCKQ